MSDNQQKFKDNLELIEIEFSSYCNRSCYFCPNSIIKRTDQDLIMPEFEYVNILFQLHEIDYSGEITFSRYNEPLADRDLLMHRLRCARLLVPNATLRINTNGDFLDEGYIMELRKEGLNHLWIQQYMPGAEEYDHDILHKKIRHRIAQYGFPAREITNIRDGKIEYDLKVAGMIVHIRARNFEKDGSNRGETVPIGKGYTRTNRCLQPFKKMFIDYNGNVMICCSLRSDIPKHQFGIMGNIVEGNLWDIFYNEKYDFWRNIHSDDGPKLGICKGCRIELKPKYD